MCIILHHLNLREKVIYVSKVCKAWKELKDKCSPGLFVDLSDKSGPKRADDMRGFVRRWVPKEDVRVATSIRLVSTENCKSSDVVLSVYFLSVIKKPPVFDTDSDDEDTLQAEKEKKSTSLSDIKKLCLVGPKIKEESISNIGMYGVGPALKVFGIDNIAHRNVPSIRGYLHCRYLLPQFNSLEVLEMPSSLVSEKGLIETLSSIGPSKTNATELRVLDLTKSTTGVPIGEEEENIHWEDVAGIGHYCPKLEKLKLPMVIGAQQDYQRQLPAAVEDDAMVPLPNLRTCAIDRIIPRAAWSGDIVISTHTVSTLLAWLLQGMPAIESLTFGLGEGDSVQSEDLPGIGNGRQICASLVFASSTSSPMHCLPPVLILTPSSLLRLWTAATTNSKP